MIVDQTAKEFKTEFVQMLKNRLGGKPEPADLLNLDEMKNVSSLDQFRPLAASLLGKIQGTGTGSCTYSVGGHQFCIMNVTQDECNKLKGDFNSMNTCSVPSWP